MKIMKMISSATAKLAVLLLAFGFVGNAWADDNIVPDFEIDEEDGPSGSGQQYVVAVGADLMLNGTTNTPSEFKTAIANVTDYNGQGVTVDFSDGESFDHKGDGPQFYVLGVADNPRITDITIANVKFYAPQSTKAQLYLYTTADVTFENCIFDNVSVSMNGTSHASKGTFTKCSFVNVKNYALKYIENAEVFNCLFDSCKRAAMFSSMKDYSHLSYVSGPTNVSGIISVEQCTFRNITEDRIIKFYEILTDENTEMSITYNTVDASSTAYFITVDFDDPGTATNNTYTIAYTGNKGVDVAKLNEEGNTEKTLYIVGDYLVDVNPDPYAAYTKVADGFYQN